MSVKTGFAPINAAASAVPVNVKLGKITSSPDAIPVAKRAK